MGDQLGFFRSIFWKLPEGMQSQSLHRWVFCSLILIQCNAKSDVKKDIHTWIRIHLEIIFCESPFLDLLHKVQPAGDLKSMRRHRNEFMGKIETSFYLFSAISRHPSKGLRQNEAHPSWSQANHRKYVKLKFKISSDLFLHKWWQSSSTASSPTVSCSWMEHKIICSTQDASWRFLWNANKNEWRTIRWLCTRAVMVKSHRVPCRLAAT